VSDNSFGAIVLQIDLLIMTRKKLQERLEMLSGVVAVPKVRLMTHML
jgi:hypothetical protein